MTGSDLIRRISWWIVVIGITSMPLQWVPVLAVGGLSLEIPNAVSAVFALLLPFALLVSRRMPYINLLFGLLFLWAALYLIAMLAHATPDGIPTLRQQIMQASLGWTLALAIAHSDLPLSRVGLWGLILLAGVLFLSSLMVGVNIIGEVINYLLTGNRNQFVYKALRPIFNAFVSGYQDLTYLASLMNEVANSLVLLSVLVLFNDGKATGPMLLFSRVVAFASLAFAFVIFSTSAALAMVVFLAIFGWKTMERASGFQKIAIVLSLAMLLIVAFGPLDDFIDANLSEDTNSRESRLGQYGHAIELISNNVFSGHGYFLYNGLPVHNWPLFSWSTAGYLPFLVVLCVYTLMMVIAVKVIVNSRGNSAFLLALVAMMVVRTSVGGGGGIPTSTAIVSMAVISGFLERQRRMARRHAPTGTAPPSLTDRYPAGGRAVPG